MAQCSVLRCNAAADSWFDYRQTPRMSTPVCSAHGARIDLGDPWLFDMADDRLHLGGDVTRLIVRSPRQTVDGSMSSAGPVYRLEVSHVDDETTTELLLTEEAFRQIAEAWTMTGPGSAETGDEG